MRISLADKKSRESWEYIAAALFDKDSDIVRFTGIIQIDRGVRMVQDALFIRGVDRAGLQGVSFTLCHTDPSASKRRAANSIYVRLEHDQGDWYVVDLWLDAMSEGAGLLMASDICAPDATIKQVAPFFVPKEIEESLRIGNSF